MKHSEVVKFITIRDQWVSYWMDIRREKERRDEVVHSPITHTDCSNCFATYTWYTWKGGRSLMGAIDAVSSLPYLSALLSGRLQCTEITVVASPYDHDPCEGTLNWSENKSSNHWNQRNLLSGNTVMKWNLFHSKIFLFQFSSIEYFEISKVKIIIKSLTSIFNLHFLLQYFSDFIDG